MSGQLFPLGLIALLLASSLFPVCVVKSGHPQLLFFPLLALQTQSQSQTQFQLQFESQFQLQFQAEFQLQSAAGTMQPVGETLPPRVAIFHTMS